MVKSPCQKGSTNDRSVRTISGQDQAAPGEDAETSSGWHADHAYSSLIPYQQTACARTGSACDERDAMIGKIFIYGLVRKPEEIFYIGATRGPDCRLRQHKKTYGGSTGMKILEIHTDIFKASRAEERWIKEGREKGWPLQNVATPPPRYVSKHKTDRNAKLQEMRDSGNTLREIAEQFGISAERVRQIVKAGK
jgi:transposase